MIILPQTNLDRLRGPSVLVARLDQLILQNQSLPFDLLVQLVLVILVVLGGLLYQAPQMLL
jgi:hypothetical protein